MSMLLTTGWTIPSQQRYRPTDSNINVISNLLHTTHFIRFPYDNLLGLVLW